MNEVERKVRDRFERILVRDHGVSAKEDEELIKGLWANLDDEDISYACVHVKAGVQDLVDNAVKSRLYQIYMGGKRGKEPAGATLGGEEVSTVNAKGPEEFQEFLDGGGEAPDSKLKATTRARIEALSEYLSRIVLADKSVVLFRSRVLSSPTKRLSPEDANALIHTLAARQQPGVRRDAETLWWPGNDEVPGAEPITVWPGSELWHLKNICSRLVKRYPWTEDQVSFLILTGQPIAVQTLRGKVSTRSTGVAAHRYHHATITLEVDSWMPSEYVRRVYHNVQRDFYGENNRQPELRNVALFCFVVRHSGLQVVDRKEGLVKLTTPQWNELRKRWNAKYPDGHDWHYQKEREHRFSRDFLRGQEAVIGTPYGLPEVPGQPMTIAQAKTSEERMIENLTRYVEKHGNQPFKEIT